MEEKSNNLVLFFVALEVGLVQIQSLLVLTCHTDKLPIEELGKQFEVSVVRLLVEFPQVERIKFFAHTLIQKNPFREDNELLDVEPGGEVYYFNLKNTFKCINVALQPLLLEIVFFVNLFEHFGLFIISRSRFE